MDFVQEAREAARQIDESEILPCLQVTKAAALDALSSQTLPTRKTENWRYTNLRPLASGQYLSRALPLSIDNVELPADFVVDGLEATRLVFVNGFYSEELSQATNQESLQQAGVNVTRFSEASDAQQKMLRENLGVATTLQNHPFAALNQSSMTDGVLLHVAKNTQAERPIHVIHLSTKQEKPFSFQQRMLAVLERGSQATLIEQFISTHDEQNSFCNGVTELFVHDNAKLTHYRLHEEESHAIHIGKTAVNLGRSATIEGFHLAMGSVLQRNDIVVNFTAEGAYCELNGIYLPRDNQQVDYHTCIEHAVPHCTSRETFRGIVSDSAKAIFNGRIHIHRDAQKTLAELSNKNLLASDKAEVNTKPELEIYADDVQCAHGATIAKIDELAIHYMKTRGIDADRARVMLSFGFVNELINSLSHEKIADYLRPKISSLF